MTFELYDPDFVLFKLHLQALLLCLPEAAMAASVNDLVDPMLVRTEFPSPAQPRSFRHSLPGPASEAAHHSGMKTLVASRAEASTEAVSHRQEDLGYDRHSRTPQRIRTSYASAACMSRSFR